MEYYLLYFNRFSPTIWRKNYTNNVWECKDKDGGGWFAIQDELLKEYVPNMILKYGHRLVCL